MMTLWPTTYDPRELKHLAESAAPAAVDWLSSHDASHLAEALERFYLPLAITLQHWRKAQNAPLILGIAGAQGSGKSILAQLLSVILERGFDYKVATLSIDDLYHPRDKRLELSRTVHPLLATRGVPGTHEVQLGRDILMHLRQLGSGQSMRLPRFDKARDDRLPVEQWDQVNGPLDIILFEGWCVGARSQPEYALKIAVNSLEEFEDEQLLWRTYINRHLASDYAELFSLLDKLIFLKAPSWESVFIWRSQQEQQLAATTPSTEQTRIMNDDTLRRFIQHYERISRLMLATTPGYADICVELGSDHQVSAVHLGHSNRNLPSREGPDPTR